jgi:hypothetical protein
VENGYVEIGCSIFMKDVMLPDHGNVLEVDLDVDVLICLLPLGDAEGDTQPDYITVRLSGDKCSEVICGEKANGVEMVFDNGEFPDSEEELMECWAQMTSARLARNIETGVKKKGDMEEGLRPILYRWRRGREQRAEEVEGQGKGIGRCHSGH